MAREGNALPLSETVLNLTGIGMTLFFVLSGFVIHYNHSSTSPALAAFTPSFVARFARLYPLITVLFLVDFSHAALASHGAFGRAGASDCPTM